MPANMRNSKITIRDTKLREPVHPCDPSPPCDPCEQKPCDYPKICKHRLKNSMQGYDTRCKSGEFMGVEPCKFEQPPHPCDPPVPCVEGKPMAGTCPDPSLYLKKIKNPESKVTRCLAEQDLYSETLCENRELLKTPIPVCKDRCPKMFTINPFVLDSELYEEERKAAIAAKAKVAAGSDIPEYMYQTTLCKNLAMLKESIKNCFKPCDKMAVFEPFTYEEQRRIALLEQYEEEENPCVREPETD